ncbi:MAG: biotin/lipoyl-binding protein [Fibrobacter sp.]|nr:biotin/lipoyl-binding protein [Fibrobacter sp.]
MKYTVRGEGTHVFELLRKNENQEFEAKFKNRSVAVRILESNPDGTMRLVMVGNRIIPVQVERRSDSFPERVWINGVSYAVDIEKVESIRYRPPRKIKEADGTVKAELPGVLTSLLVTEGDEVVKGQVLGILEAMKMENELNAPRSGVVKSIAVKAGNAVMRGDILLEIE